MSVLINCSCKVVSCSRVLNDSAMRSAGRGDWECGRGDSGECADVVCVLWMRVRDRETSTTCSLKKERVSE